MTTYPIDETMALWREGLLSAGECLRDVLAGTGTGSGAGSDREQIGAIRELARRAGACFRIRHHETLDRADPGLYGYLTRYWLAKGV